MRKLIVFLIFLALSLWLGVIIARHPGYLFIVSKPVLIQIPLWFAALVLIVVLGIFYIVIHSIDRLQFWCFRVKNWMRLRREHGAYSRTQHGLALLIEGRWSKAEKLLIQGADQGVEPLMNYIGAARAAQGLKAFDRRNTYLRKAYEIAPEAELAIGLTQAELELEQNQLEQASATLSRLRKISNRHPAVLKLLEKVYVHLADWDQLAALLPEMRRARVLTQDQLVHFEKNIACERLRVAGMKNREDLKAVWNGLSRSERKHPEIVTTYVKQLLTFGDQTEAEELIRYTLKYQWVPELAAIYGRFSFGDLNRQLVIAGAWLKMYGPQPETLLFLGKTCAAIQLWGKARDYFEDCLELSPSPEAALEYGRLLDGLGERDTAVLQYREVLQALVGKV